MVAMVTLLVTPAAARAELWTPTGLHVTSVSSASVGLDWDSEPTGNRLNYWSYTYDAAGALLRRTYEDTSATTVQSLAPCTPYTFRVSVQMAAGEGPLSAPVNATTTGCSTGGGTTSTAGPHGPSGTWVQTFDDEFDATLDPAKWTNSWFGGGSMNGVATSQANVSVAGGAAALQLSDSSHGALIHTTQAAGRFSLPVGSVLEARIWFPGNGSALDNWPAFWANDTAHYPQGGENDIAEVMSDGCLAVNYHSSSGSHNQGCVPGYWGDAWHTFTLYRQASRASVYYDGTLVKSYATDDNGAPEDVILNVGRHSSNTVIGAAGAIRVDYVRGWASG